MKLLISISPPKTNMASWKKNIILKMYVLLKIWTFQCHVSLQGVDVLSILHGRFRT